MTVTDCGPYQTPSLDPSSVRDPINMYSLSLHEPPKVSYIPYEKFLPQLNDPSLFRQKAYINGEWIDAKDGKTFDVYGVSPDMHNLTCRSRFG